MRLAAGLAGLLILSACAAPVQRETVSRQIGSTLPQAAYAQEDADFRVAPVSVPHRAMEGPTPTTLPGATVITTAELNRAVAANATALVNVLPGAESAIPGSIHLSGAGAYSTDEDMHRAKLAKALAAARLTDTSAPITFYCAHSRCWYSYNAALRAVALGYTSVRWYRGGLAAWQDAGLPVVGIPADRW